MMVIAMQSVVESLTVFKTLKEAKAEWDGA